MISLLVECVVPLILPFSLGGMDLDLDQGLTIIIKVILHMFFNEFGLIPNSNLPTLRKFLETDIDFGKT